MKSKRDLYSYDDIVYEQAEISGNKFNLLYSFSMIILSVGVVLLTVLKVFRVSITIVLPISILAMILFILPFFILIFHDKILKKNPSLLKWWRYKYVIYIFTYFGLLAIDLTFSFHAVILIVIPPLMAAQYRFIKRDWIIIFITTIITIPLVLYGSILIGIPDLNIFKNMIEPDKLNDFSSRLSILTTKRCFEIFIHYCLPRILAVIAIDFLIAEIVKRNREMLDKQAELNKKINLQMKKSNDLQNAVIEELASVIESRDINTGAHVRRTKKYVEILCNEMMKTDKYKNIMTPDLAHKIISASPLHDIGKIAVSDLILLKPGKLTPEEFNKMKIHTIKGGELIEDFFKQFEDDSFLKEAYEIALYHHEKWDGTGYPDGLKEKQIPLVARIMAIADVYDALTSKRVYKEPYTKEEAYNIIIAGTGNHFDPDLVEIFKKVRNEFEEVINVEL